MLQMSHAQDVPFLSRRNPGQDSVAPAIPQNTTSNSRLSLTTNTPSYACQTDIGKSKPARCNSDPLIPTVPCLPILLSILVVVYNTTGLWGYLLCCFSICVPHIPSYHECRYWSSVKEQVYLNKVCLLFLIKKQTASLFLYLGVF